jgi:predicted TIM-barrel fold metal-dependent hydrolase
MPSIEGWAVDAKIYDARVSGRIEVRGATPGREPVIPIEEFFRQLDENEIVAGVMVGRDIESTFGAKVPNDEIAALANEYKGRLYGFAGIDVHKGFEAVREIERLVKEGIKGISIDPWLQKVDVDDERCYPIYEKCAELDIPVILTAVIPVHLAPRSYPSEGSHPLKVDRVLCKFQELKIIITHAGVPWYMEYIHVARKHPTLYLEIHGCMSEYIGIDVIFQAANLFLQDQVVYSSSYPWGRLDEYKLIEDRITSEPEKFFYSNAAGLLHLN